MADFTKRNVTYGKKFKRGKRMVMYRYLNKKASSRVLVDAKTKKLIKR